VTIIFYGSVQEYTFKEKSLAISYTQSIRTLIDLLGKRFGARFREFLLGDNNCFFLINGKGIMTIGGLDAPLHEEDTVEILPFVDAG